MDMKSVFFFVFLIVFIDHTSSQSWNMRSQHQDLLEYYPHLRHFVGHPKYTGSYRHGNDDDDNVNYEPKYPHDEEERDDYYTSSYGHKQKKWSHKPMKDHNEYNNYQDRPLPDHYNKHYEDWAEKKEPPHYGYLNHDIHSPKKHYYYAPKHEYKHEYRHEISHYRPKKPYEPYEDVYKHHSSAEPKDYSPEQYDSYKPDDYQPYKPEPSHDGNDGYENEEPGEEDGYNNFAFDSPFDYGKLDFASSADSFAFNSKVNHVDSFSDQRIHSPKKLAKILGV